MDKDEKEGSKMSEHYEPEIGQFIFGQPWKEHRASHLLESALRMISDELDRIMWNIHQEEYASPFGNTAAKFNEIEAFQVEAYSWNDEVEQPWNFKCGDVEVSWYKYLGRGMSVSRDLSPQEINDVLNTCLEALWEYEKENDEDF